RLQRITESARFRRCWPLRTASSSIRWLARSPRASCHAGFSMRPPEAATRGHAAPFSWPLMIDPLAAGWEAVDDPGFIGLVGPIVRRARGDDDEYGFVAEPKHANLSEVVQGGMLMTFADRALGRTA